MKKLLFVFSFLLLLLSCKKDSTVKFCEKNPSECVDVRTVKDYFYFKVGAYWVYEEENTGLRDSVYVTESSSDPESVIFDTWVHSTYDGYDYTFWTTGTGWTVNNIAKKSDRSTGVYRAKTRPGDYIAESKCFLFYPVPERWTYTYGGAYVSNNVLKVEQIYNTLIIQENSFSNVVCLSEQHTAIEESQPTVHYYAPNIGLVKKELIDSNQVWNLVNYKIVK